MVAWREKEPPEKRSLESPFVRRRIDHYRKGYGLLTSPIWGIDQEAIETYSIESLIGRG